MITATSWHRTINWYKANTVDLLYVVTNDYYPSTSGALFNQLVDLYNLPVVTGRHCWLGVPQADRGLVMGPALAADAAAGFMATSSASGLPGPPGPTCLRRADYTFFSTSLLSSWVFRLGRLSWRGFFLLSTFTRLYLGSRVSLTLYFG